MNIPVITGIEQGFIVAVDLPDKPVSLLNAPQLNLKIEYMKLRQYKVPDVLWHCAVVKTGFYSASSPKKIAENTDLFSTENAAELLSGNHAKDGWLPYSFVATPTTLRIDYYYIRNPQKCGFIELGRDFNQLWVNFTPSEDKVQVLLKSDTYRILDDRTHFIRSIPSTRVLQWEVNMIRVMDAESRLLRSKREFVNGCVSIKCLIKGESTPFYDCTLSSKDYDSNHFDDVDPDDAN